MPARIRKIMHDDETRAKIQGAHIVRRLKECFDGSIELSKEQISIGIALLRKVLPDLAMVEHSGEVQTTYVARLPAARAKDQPAAAAMDEWQKQHAPGVNKTVQ